MRPKDLWRRRWPYLICIAKYVGIRAGAVVGKDGHVEGMPVSGLQQVEEETPLEEQRSFE